MMEGWKPSIIIAIDFGMTCTGVAFSSYPEWTEPKCIQRWPGLLRGSQLADKVATEVGYDENDRLVSWGFKCKYATQDLTLEKEFKLYLDPNFTDTHEDRPTHAQAVRYYVDYMKCLCRHLESFFNDSIPNWSGRNVEFLFSIPTTWRNPRLTAMLEQWLVEAGFETTEKRRVRISQTEAEAAAVYVSKQYFTVGDIIMVADAGGSTTDINVLELKEHNSERTLLKALNKAEGINVGSTLIDWQVKGLLRSRLKALNLPGDENSILQAVEDMLDQNEFESIKCAFDESRVHVDSHLDVPLTATGPVRGGRNLKVILTGSELKEFFDVQLSLMFNKIDQQRRELSRDKPGVSLKYLVLSGGLGSSKYVQQRMKSRYSELNVLCASEPQLAVAKGLVMDRVQALRKGVGVYTGKCSRVSYGVLCREVYDPVRHKGEDLTHDPLDRVVWAEKQIDWLVKEGQPVPDDGFLRPYRLKIPVGAENESIKAQFVMSDSPITNLPRSIKSDDVVRLCTTVANFHHEEFRSGSSSRKPFKFVKGRIFSKVQDHYVAEFNLKVIVGSADLKFELVSKDGVSYTQNQARVDVQWEDVVTSKSSGGHNSRDIYAVSSDHQEKKSWRPGRMSIP